MGNVKVGLNGKTVWMRMSLEMWEAVAELADERGLYHGQNEDGTPKPNVGGMAREIIGRDEEVTAMMARIALRCGVGALLNCNGKGSDDTDSGTAV